MVLTEYFSYVFPQTIWRIVPHPAPGLNTWAFELRDAEQKKVSFALIDLEGPGVRWEEEPEGTDWWTTLTAVSGNQVFLHNYRFPDLPEPTDLIAVSADTGQGLWAVPNYVFVRVLDEKDILVATRQPERILYKRCDIQSGLLQPYIEEVPAAPAAQPLYKVPLRYRQRDIYFDTLSSFLDKSVNVRDAVVIDYLESDPYIAFSYYIYESGKIAQYILLVNRQRAVLYHEKVGEGRDGVGQDTLFLKGEYLVFLRNNNEFVSIKLRP